MSLRLVMEAIEGVVPEARFAVDGPEAIIGRAEQCDIVVNAASVSGRHGLIKANALGYVFTDLGSTNGSALLKAGAVELVPLRPGQQAQVAPGDTLVLGNAEPPISLRVEAGVAAYEAAPAPDRTAIASSPLADLLRDAPRDLLQLAARTIDADSVADLAQAALAFLQATEPASSEQSVKLYSSGSVTLAGVALDAETEAYVRGERDVVRTQTHPDRVALVAPLIAHGSWHGYLSVASASVPPPTVEDALGVASPLVALGVVALGVREAADLAQAKLQRELDAARQVRAEGFVEPVGSDSSYLDAMSLCRELAPADISVLLLGETGSGKEVLARAVHEWSPRATGPFVALNCGAVPANLLEAELFGHVKGAFTGAMSDRAGLFEQADGGTLFLDEVGEMPLDMQARFLRVLEDGEVRRVGATKNTRVDVRIVSATNRDLAEMSDAGTFRTDLMYRLDAASVRIPPLRQRGDDVVLLAHHFLQDRCRRAKKTLPGFSPEAIWALTKHPWPGNVRELRNEIERAVALTRDGTAVQPHGFSARVTPRTKGEAQGAAPTEQTLKDCVERAERFAVESALAVNDGNVTRAAKTLGLSRPGLYKLLIRLGMKRDAG